MFASYPGFEDLPLRVEVEWQDRARPVVARLEQWPGSTDAVVVCAFEDDENNGEWLVIGNGLIPYQLGNPYTKVKETHVYRVETREPVLAWQDRNQSDQTIGKVIQKAFSDDKHYGIGRLLKLSHLPCEPRVALRTLKQSVWLPNYAHESWVAFEGEAQQNLTERHEHLRLEEDYERAGSDARFAWEWARLDDEQRKNRLGFDGDIKQLERVMSLVLTARNHDWKEQDWFF